LESGETVNLEIKDRIAKIKAGQVPEGYKKTKVGIVPQEWKSNSISHYITLVERPIVMDDNAEYELVTVRRGFGGVDSRGFLLGKKVLVKSQFTVKEKDFVISKRQIAHGACGIIPKELDGAIVSNEYNIFIGRNNVDVVFFNYFMQLPELKRLFYLMSNGVHIEKLLFKTNDWIKQKICVPSLSEQQKIVKILTVWDKGIELKQKLIAEKKAQKKWLMQRLLTGEKRLAGFNGKWERKSISKLAEVVTGITPPTNNPEFYNGKYPWITPTDITSNKYIQESERALSEMGLKNGRFIPKGSLLVTCIASIGKNAILTRDGSCNQQINAIIPSPKVSNEFLYYAIEFNLNILIKYAGKSATPILNKETFSNLTFCFPLLPEQTAIAEILSTADRQIELLEKEHAELTQQKKGLMQLLLTGIVRVNS